MWNPFKKSGKQNSNQLGMLQKIAMKKMAKMSPQEQSKMMQDVLKPENRGKLMTAMEQMKKTGMISEEQIAEAKKRLGM